MDLIFVPFHDYKLYQKEGFRTRDAHFLRSFEASKDIDKILVVNRPTSLAELLLKKKKLRTTGDLILSKNNCYLTRVSDKTFCLDILLLDTLSVARKKRMWIPTAYENSRVLTFYKDVLKHLGMNGDIAYTSTPLTIPFFKNNFFGKVVFDAVDNLMKYNIFSTDDKTLLQSFYEYGLTSDLFVCNSNDSLNYFNKKGSANLVMIPNGVDPQEFREPSTFIPLDLKDIPRPIVGYGGKMQVMFDLELLEKLSKQFPHVSFVLVGQILDKEYMKRIYDFGNVYYLGDKNYREYVNYIKNFDICMIPYRLDTQHGGDPIKFYEYLSANKPIISTEIGEIKAFDNFNDVFIVKTHQQFLSALEKLNSSFQGMQIERKIPNEVTWDFKVEKIMRLVQ